MFSENFQIVKSSFFVRISKLEFLETYGEYPQFLHHRAYRSREIDPGRPFSGAHRNRRKEKHERAAPRFHGSGTGARDHYQIAAGADALEGLPVEPHRYARARRFPVRS